MQIQLSIFLYVYLAFVALWLIFNLVAVYHMFRYGIKSAVTYMATLVFVGVSALIIFYSYSYISGIDWGTSLPLTTGLQQSSQDIWN